MSGKQLTVGMMRTYPMSLPRRPGRVENHITFVPDDADISDESTT